MDRPGFNDEVPFFYGTEVEQTPAFGKRTLFVVGVQSINQIAEKIMGCDHIYFGANMSFPRRPTYHEYRPWHDMVEYFLERDYWCTLDMDVDSMGEFHEGNLCEYRRFIPMISVKLPYINLLNYNAVLKIDDRDFESTNPGVWCHRVHKLTNPESFTDWDQYKNDSIA